MSRTSNNLIAASTDALSVVFLLIGIIGVLALALVPAAFFLFGYFGRGVVYAAAVIIAATIVSFALSGCCAMLTKRLRRADVREGHCPSCGYSLRGREGTVRCPECGHLV